MLEAVLQQINNLVASYDQLAVTTGNQKLWEGSSGNVLKFNSNPLFEGAAGIQGRTLCLDFPKFDWSEPTKWILKAQQFFAYGNTPDEQKLQIVVFHMEDKALSWYCLMDSSPVNSWEEFVVALKFHIRPSAYEDPIRAFTKFR